MTNASHLQVLMKLCAVGAMTAVVYFSALWIGMHCIVLHYLYAVSIAYLLATTFHFLMNRRFTFQATDGQHVEQLTRYLILCFLNYGITVLMVWLAVAHWALSPYVGSLGAIFATINTNYFLGRYWVFN